jgi:hypothetical protein
MPKKDNKRGHLKWFSLLKPVFDRLFGENWQKDDQEFWDAFDNHQLSGRDDVQKME